MNQLLAFRYWISEERPTLFSIHILLQLVLLTDQSLRIFFVLKNQKFSKVVKKNDSSFYSGWIDMGIETVIRLGILL